MRRDDPNPWSLRPARADDAAGVTALIEAAYGPYVARLGSSLPVGGDYATEIAQHPVWVADDRGQIVGALVLYRRRDHMLLANVAVHPDHQGRGLGRTLIDWAESTARAEGYHEMRLFTHREMSENVALYGRLGWVELKSEPESNKVAMIKRLS